MLEIKFFLYIEIVGTWCGESTMQVLAAALVGVYAEDNAKAIPFYLKYLEEIFNVLRINITDNGCVVPVCSSWFLDPLVHCWVD